MDGGKEGLFFGAKDDLKVNFEPGQFIQVNDTINRLMISQMVALLDVCRTSGA